MKVLVIVAGGLQARYLGCYGNEWVSTPHLDRLASEAVVFDRHFADHPTFAGTRASWRSGCYSSPSRQSRNDLSRNAREDLIAVLRRANVPCHLVWEHGNDADKSFCEGWSRVRRAKAAPKGGLPLADAIGQAAKGLDQLASQESWLLWLDLAALVPPWRVPDEILQIYFPPDAFEEADEENADEVDETASLTPCFEPKLGRLDSADCNLIQRLQRSYAAAVTYLDTAFGALTDELRERDLLEEVLLIFTSDRGCPLGEHGFLGEGAPWLHEELIHIPLIVRLPQARAAGARLFALTQPVDLFPTLATAFGIQTPPVHGHDLLPLCQDEVRQVRSYAFCGRELDDAGAWVIRTADWAMLLSREAGVNQFLPPKLFAKPEDRFEVNDLVQHHWAYVQHLECVLKQFAEAVHAPGPMRIPELRTEEELVADPPVEAVSNRPSEGVTP